MNAPVPTPPTHLVARLAHHIPWLRGRRHATFFVALAAGAVVLLASLPIDPGFAVVLGAIAMFATYLALIGLALPSFTASYLQTKAADSDAPVAFIFVVVVLVVASCCITLFTALNGQGTPAAIEVGLSIVSVLLGWFTIHTMAAMHYAYEFYEPPPGGATDAEPLSGGLVFPDNEAPDAIEFIYFSYVIGVAFAVSDIQIHSRKMRRFVLVHSTFAYFFNTLIVAATVNVAVAVGS